MNKNLLIFSIFFVGLVTSISEDHATLLKFKQFVMKHQKTYASEEFLSRFNIFQENLLKIERLNKEQKTAKFGINKFSDLTADEFRRFYSGTKVAKKNPTWPMLPLKSTKELSSVPPSWDWTTLGAVTPVKNQGQCGSCWAFSSTGNIEGQWFLSGKTLTSLSEQNLVDCDHECMEYEGEQACDAGCEGGLMPNAFNYVLKNKGIDTETSYPYTGQDGSCKSNSKNIGATITNWTMVPSDEIQMAAYLKEIGPLSVAVDAEAWQFYFGGVLQIGMFCGTTLDHGVLIVGYGNETNIFDQTVNFWKIKNSWGEDWGENGYIRITRGNDECGVDIFPCTSLIGKKN